MAVGARLGDQDGHEHHAAEWTDWVRVAFVALAAGAVWFRVWEPFPRVSVIGLAAALVGGWPIFREAWDNLRACAMTMELSVYFALGAAALMFLVTRDARSTISVIIVAGACGIAAGTPLAILGAIGRAARQGAIVKGGLHLETLARVDTIAFDKTGTLTFGTPEVRAARPAPGVSETQLVEAAAVAERRSEHPLGQAILRRAAALGLAPAEPAHFASTPGRGVVARVAGLAHGPVDGPTGDILVGSAAFLRERGVALPADARVAPEGGEAVATRVLVARDGRYLGALAVADTIRPEAKDALGALRRLGIKTMLLTGDARAVAKAVSLELGVDEMVAELLPEKKLEHVRGLVGRGRVVAMVGDGVNDAPALTAADVGVAMGAAAA